MDLPATIDINRPAAEVFNYVMEVLHDAEWRRTGRLIVGIAEHEAVHSDHPFNVRTEHLTRATVSQSGTIGGARAGRRYERLLTRLTRAPLAGAASHQHK